MFYYDPKYSLPSDAQIELSDCLAKVGLDGSLRSVLVDVEESVRAWRAYFKMHQRDVPRADKIRRQLVAIAESDEDQARELLRHVHTDTFNLVVRGKCFLDGLEGLALRGDIRPAAAIMLDAPYRAKGRPVKPWRAPMVCEFDGLWVKAVGRGDYAVDEGTPRARWITALVECVEGITLEPRYLERLMKQESCFIPWWSPLLVPRSKPLDY